MKAKPTFVDQQENFSNPYPLNSIGIEEFGISIKSWGEIKMNW